MKVEAGVVTLTERALQGIIENAHKAGMEEEAKGGHNAISYLEGKKVGEKLGMDKVVELVGKEPFEHNYSMSEHHIDDCFACKYEAKLKEWGI